MRHQKLIRSTILAALLLGLASPTWAWTNKPVKVLVPAPAGGTMDIVARILGDQIGAEIGQPVIIDNRPGAGGALGVQALMQAPADGQTIMITASNVLVEIPHVMKTAFDPLKDVKPVATVATATMVLVGHPDLPAKNLKELMAYMKTLPGNGAFASYSAGTSSHYAGMILNQRSGMTMQHIPFPGSPPALNQVMGKQIPIMFDGMATSLPQIKGGKLKAFAVAARARSTHLPDVPTLAEEGQPDMVYTNWLGVVVSAATSAELADRINGVILRVAESPKVKTRLVGAGFEPNTPMTAAQLAQSVRDDYQRNAAIVRQFNIKLD